MVPFAWPDVFKSASVVAAAVLFFLGLCVVPCVFGAHVGPRPPVCAPWTSSSFSSWCSVVLWRDTCYRCAAALSAPTSLCFLVRVCWLGKCVVFSSFRLVCRTCSVKMRPDRFCATTACCNIRWSSETWVRRLVYQAKGIRSHECWSWKTRLSCGRMLE